MSWGTRKDKSKERGKLEGEKTEEGKAREQPRQGEAGGERKEKEANVQSR